MTELPGNYVTVDTTLKVVPTVVVSGHQSTPGSQSSSKAALLGSGSYFRICALLGLGRPTNPSTVVS